MKYLRLTAWLLVLLTLLCACSVADSEKEDGSPVSLRVFTLNGTTGFGMAKLMENGSSDADAVYSFTVKSDASDVLAALLNGDADIGALPTNAASNLFNLSEGAFEVLAVNTKGCLYLLSGGTAITDWKDLKGRTVYVPAQNPTFIFTYLCEENGLTVGTDVMVDSTSYAAAANLKDAVASGAVELAVLPEPMVTIAKSAAANASLSVSDCMNLSAEWDKVAPNGSLVQGCIVVSKSFLGEHPDTVAAFLQSYEQSLNFTVQSPAEASELIVKHGIFTNAKVAQKAIPNCNLTYLDGAEMKSAMTAYLNVLYSINPKSIGGALPTDGFYYEAK